MYYKDNLRVNYNDARYRVLTRFFLGYIVHIPLKENLPCVLTYL